MADRLKGITVEIGGDTTNLQGALQDVNKKGKQLQRELADVQRLLRFDPENVDLLAQRQDLLTQSIENTSERLETLRRTQQQVQQQFERGELGADQYRAFQREIIQTEQRLEHFEREAQGTARDVRGAFKGLGGGLASGIAGAVAGAGIGAIISKSLETAALDTQIDISFAIPEESKQIVKDTLSNIEALGVDGESAMEGLRRQFAMNIDQTKEQNAAVVESAAVITKSFSQIDFTELIQEANEMATAFGISQEDALAMTNSLLKMGFPPDQLDIITEYGNQLAIAGYNAMEIQGIMASAAAADPWNIDVLLDGVKEGRINMAAFGEDIDKAMSDLMEGTTMNAKQLEVWGDAVAAGGAEGKVAMEEVTKAVMAIEDPAKRNALGVKVFGTLWEENGEKIAQTILGANENMGDMKNNTDALAASTEAINSDPTVRLKKALSDLMTVITPLLTQVAEFTAKMADWISKNPALAAGIGAVAVGIGLLIAAGMALAPVISLLSAAAISLQIGMLPLIAIILGIIVGIGLLVAGIVWLVKNWDMVEAKLDAFFAASDQAFADWVAGVKERFNEQVRDAKAMVAKIKQAFDDWKTGVTERWNKGIQDIKDAWNGAIAWFKGIDLKQIGKDIIKGLINGIGEMKDKLFAKARELANGIGRTISGALKIKSPSKVTMLLGEQAGDGLAAGLFNSIGKVQSMGIRVANTIADTMGGTLGQALEDSQSALTLYFDTVRQEGDWMNDWLTHMPNQVAELAAQMGRALEYDLEGATTAGQIQKAAQKALTVNIHSPKALDVREANREFSKALTKMSLMW